MKVVVWQSNICSHIDDNLVLVAGFFESVHIGHMTLINKAKKIAEEKRAKLGVITFDKMPTKWAKHNTNKILSSKEERINLFRELGFDYCFIINFTNEFSLLSPEEFLKQYFGEISNITAVVCGPDYKFGKNGKGNVAMLKKHYKVEEVEFNKKDGHKVSTTDIKDLVLKGHVEEANKLLVKPFTITGFVVHGQHLATLMGFPTANLLTEGDSIMPADGVYATKTHIGDKTYFGLTSIGYNPTISLQDTKRIENHIFGFSENIYDRKIKVEFVKFLRPQSKFKDKYELIQQVKKDIETGKKLFAINE